MSLAEASGGEWTPEAPDSRNLLHMFEFAAKVLQQVQNFLFACCSMFVTSDLLCDGVDQTMHYLTVTNAGHCHSAVLRVFSTLTSCCEMLQVLLH